MSPEIIDLTRLLDRELPVYSDGLYSDPPFEIETWCTVAEQGYRVSRLSLGTQTGTHIDAPAHFAADGAELEELPVGALFGPYLWLDLTEASTPGIGYRDEPILFLTASKTVRVEISSEKLQMLLALPCRVWVIACEVQVAGSEPFYLHRALAQAGKYLIEDLNETQAARVQPGGELFALPLHLSGASGAPCRVVVRQPLVGPEARDQTLPIENRITSGLALILARLRTFFME
jgi:kynurenine formamidase